MDHPATDPRDAEIGRLAVADYLARQTWAKLVVAKSPDAPAAHAESCRARQSLEQAIQAKINAH